LNRCPLPSLHQTILLCRPLVIYLGYELVFGIGFGYCRTIRYVHNEVGKLK
jgi:hypothetical protein